MDIWCKKGLRGLEAADEAAQEAIRKIKVGEVVRCDITRPRNLAMHKKFFALVNTVWAATGVWSSPEELLVELKLNLGLYREVTVRSTGEVVKVPGSISFAKMDQGQFDIFFNSALKELCELAGGIEFDALREAVLDSLAA